MSTHMDMTSKARRWFWGLTVVAILAAGSLSSALTAQSGALTALRVLASGLVLAVSVSLAGRVLVALSPPRRRPDRRTDSAKES